MFDPRKAKSGGIEPVGLSKNPTSVKVEQSVVINVGNKRYLGSLLTQPASVVNLEVVRELSQTVYFETISGNCYRLQFPAKQLMPNLMALVNSRQGNEITTDLSSSDKELIIGSPFKFEDDQKLGHTNFIKNILVIERLTPPNHTEASNPLAQAILNSFSKDLASNMTPLTRKSIEEFRKRKLQNDEFGEEALLTSACRRYSFLLTDYYKDLRSDRRGIINEAVVTGRIPHDPKIDNYIVERNSEIVAHKGSNPNYIFRRSLVTSLDSVERAVCTKKIALSVVATKGVIEALDKFVKRYSYVVYKIPTQNHDWLDRNDPITVYFYMDVTNSMKSDIVTLLAKHTRNNFGVCLPLLGEELHPGIALEDYPSANDRKAAFKKLKDIDPLAEVAARLHYTQIDIYGIKDNKLSMSSGELEACKMLHRFLIS